jgi:hypothetical protein
MIVILEGLKKTRKIFKTVSDTGNIFRENALNLIQNFCAFF